MHTFIYRSAVQMGIRYVNKVISIYQKYRFTTYFYLFQHLLELTFIHENILKHDFYVLLLNVSIHSCIFVDSIFVGVHVCMCVCLIQNSQV